MMVASATFAQTGQSSQPTSSEGASAQTAAPVSRSSMKPTNDPKKPFPAGAAFYIEDMEQDLDGFLRAEITKERLPIKLVLSPDKPISS